MFKTIKSKIILITLSMFVLLTVAVVFLALELYKSGKNLAIEYSKSLVSSYGYSINSEIQFFEEKTNDLASEAEIIYKFERKNPKFFDYIVLKSFEDNKKSVGGGLWFEPYKINKKYKRFCSYAFHKNGKLSIDKKFEKDSYNFHQRSWYKEIKKDLMSGKRVAWATPYIDSIGTSSYMTTIGVAIFDDNGDFIGMSTADWSLESIINKISELRPTKNSFVLFADADNDFVLASTNDKSLIGKSLNTVKWYKDDLKDASRIEYDGIKYISFIKALENGMVLVVNVPEKEMFAQMFKYIAGMTLFLVAACILLAVCVYLMLVHNINKPVDVMIKAQEQMDFELKTAKAIQSSALPNIFPPFPEHKEFDIFASMDTAKEVGGDFYDFFFIAVDKFAFVCADVSGKGIPAALFMMNTKTLIKNLTKTKIPLDKVMTKVNKTLCKNNEQGFFVTAFLCVVDLSSGKVTYVNAGHTPPLLKKNGCDFEYINCDSNLVLGAVNDFEYTCQQFNLEKGESVFLYTDGVTEAVNNNFKMYGDDRLKKTLNTLEIEGVEGILKKVKNDIEEFSQGAELADDITMLAFKYNGFDIRKEGDELKIVLPADIKYLDNLISKVENFSDETGAKDSDKMKLCVCAEELFVNITNYAYPPDKDNKVVEITFKYDEQQIELCFEDFGAPYNPLAKADPDITLSAEERPIGGLGVFIVKQSMDSVSYSYRDGKNVMLIKLKIS